MVPLPNFLLILFQYYFISHTEKGVRLYVTHWEREAKPYKLIRASLLSWDNKTHFGNVLQEVPYTHVRTQEVNLTQVDCPKQWVRLQNEIKNPAEV